MSIERADVVVVGGGVIGAAVLFELAQRGVRGLLLEGRAFGRESTGKSAAIVRMHYSNPAVVRMALRSREVLQRFSEITGRDGVYRETGWSYVVPPDAVETVREVAEMTRAQGVEVVEIGVDEARKLYPSLSPDGVAGIFLEPQSGYADPYATTLGYLDAARKAGARTLEGVAVRRLVGGDGAVRGVETDRGVIHADSVVLAAGAWSHKLAATIALDLPYMITREEELYLDVPRHLRPRASMSNLVDQIYVRPLDEWQHRHPGALLLGRGFPKEYDIVDPDDYDGDLSRDFEQDVRERLARRLPGLEDAPLLGGIVGLYAVTPDWHPYLGRVDGIDGLVLATGGSGHCFKLAPAIAEMVAADMVGDEVNYASVDEFNVERIRHGRLFQAAIGGNRA
jgi:glycine/D-amino acid oxidase-like deaminating enzyme